jgi:hypothetical protein
MSGPDAHSILAGVLLDAGLKSVVMLTLSGFGTFLLRKGSAAQRHALWACGFASLPLLGLAAAQRGPEIALEAPWLVPIWLLGVGIAALPPLRGMAGLARLRREAQEDPQTPGLLHSAALRGPLTWGFRRPIIVLPACASAWSPAQRAAALAHERAHVRRHDWAVHMAVWAICALFWFNPLVWLARRVLALEAEHAADDAALAEGARPDDYAALLVSLRGAGGPKTGLYAGGSPLGRRVRAVLGSRSRGHTRRWILCLGLSLGAAASTALGALPTWTRSAEELTCSPGTSP